MPTPELEDSDLTELPMMAAMTRVGLDDVFDLGCFLRKHSPT
jgi:hypothetical protein